MIPCLTPDLAPIARTATLDQTRTNQVDEELTIRAPEWSEDIEQGVITFSGGVTAIYGATTLQTDTLVVYRGEKRMLAEGKTIILDPEARVAADHVEIYWQSGARRGVARNVDITVGYVHISGDVLTTITDPEPLWVVDNARVELSDLARGNNRFFARRIRVYPGRYGIAEGITYQILGQKIGPIGSQRFNLDRRVTGFKLPSITNRRGVGFGVSWDSSLLLSEKSSLQLALGAFPGRAQEYRAQFTYSPLASERTVTRLAPRDDLAERQNDGWFNSVIVPSPETEFQRISDNKNSFSIGSFWNTSTVGRRADGIDVSKLGEAAYEWGGSVLGGGLISTVRAQRIRESGGPWVDRAAMQTTLIGPRVSLGPQIAVHTRLDAFGTAGKNQYGFVRSEVGVIGRVGDGITLGAAYIAGREAGEPDFAFDRLDFNSSVHLRADYVVGPYTLRYLAKYDISRRSWYDREWEIALAAGSLEPFMVRREFPSDYRIGIRFRIDAFTQRLEQRSVKR